MSQIDQFCCDLFKSGFKSSRFHFRSYTGILPNSFFILKYILLPIFDRQIRIYYQISPHPMANCEMIQKQTVTVKID